MSEETEGYSVGITPVPRGPIGIPSAKAREGMSNLVEGAKLTEKEILFLLPPGLRFLTVGGVGYAPTNQDVADVATAKALWACVEWLKQAEEESARITMESLPAGIAAEILGDLLQQAGIERPECA